MRSRYTAFVTGDTDYLAPHLAPQFPACATWTLTRR